MIIVKSPLRISLFGGSTDYPSFFKDHGSFLIGTTINKYIWLSARYRPKILPREHSISYSKLEVVKSADEIQNPLIRTILQHYDPKGHIDFSSSVDVPSRTGLGGSSSFCTAMIYLMHQLKGKELSKKEIANAAMHIERQVLKESGGIQDHIWAAYGGLNSISIRKDGSFLVKPLPVSGKFKRKLEDSIVLIYTNDQRDEDAIARSHERKNKKRILDLSKDAYKAFLKEDIGEIGRLLTETWKEKRGLSPLISSQKIDTIIDAVMHMGAHGAKLLGSGGSGFVMVLCDGDVKKKLVRKFKEDILEVKFEDHGTSVVYTNS